MIGRRLVFVFALMLTVSAAPIFDNYTTTQMSTKATMTLSANESFIYESAESSVEKDDQEETTRTIELITTDYPTSTSDETTPTSIDVSLFESIDELLLTPTTDSLSSDQRRTMDDEDDD